MTAVGAFADRVCPMVIAPSPTFELALSSGRVRRSVATEVPSGAATAPSASLAVAAAVEEPTTPVKDSVCVLSRRTDAAPMPPFINLAVTPRAADCGDVGHVIAIAYCANPPLPTSIVAVFSVASHLTMDKSRKGIVTLTGKTPRGTTAGSPLAALTETETTRESRGRPGKRSTADVGRGAAPCNRPWEAEAALVPPVAAITASSAVAPSMRAARRRAGESASVFAATFISVIARSLNAGGAAYTPSIAVSLKGDVPHCVSDTDERGENLARAAVAAVLVITAGAGCAATISLGRVVDLVEHGFRLDVSANDSATPAPGFTTDVEIAGPQYDPPGEDALDGAVDNIWGTLTGAFWTTPEARDDMAETTRASSVGGAPPVGSSTTGGRFTDEL